MNLVDATTYQIMRLRTMRLFIAKCSVLIVIAKEEEKKEIKQVLSTAYNSLLSECDVSNDIIAPS